MKTTIEKQIVLNGSYGIRKPAPIGVQMHVITVWHLLRSGKRIATVGSRREARVARLEGAR